MKIIDATDLIVGRLATKVAKMALLGEDIVILNSEKAIMTGSKQEVVDKFKRKYSMGVPRKGPFIHRRPERLLKRSIRGMLPYNKAHGREAFERIKCYMGVPEQFQDAKKETFDEANIVKVPSLKYVYLLTVSKILGAKV